MDDSDPGTPSPGYAWKFGYGSNMGMEFLRSKKGLNPLDMRRCILTGWSLSFPRGAGLDYVEPAWATLKEDAEGKVHGVAVLFNAEDKTKLDAQEGGYLCEFRKVDLYNGKTKMHAEVYLPKKQRPADHPEGECSARYRDILVNGAKEANLDAAWVAKLERLATYKPDAETLALRDTLPPVSNLPVMTISDLARHDGTDEGFEVYTSACGFIFKQKGGFKVYRGRDITFRNVLHSRHINLDANDDGGKSPFPRLTHLEPSALAYALCYRDRFMHKAGAPVAVLSEFWAEQEAGDLAGVYTSNTLSSL
mmetsp:Transcript_35278/g.61926  ORF Transcript_35278/g.61926 Transcript_35278/m.61926 type:complete len:307 (+) Transcript_35278:2-922(+)